ncbi:50S ribosomal protein L17 [bacterium]|jgi:large subunit ribosomal protein L17|nr:50S ribosomal protein L17 [bacterium]MBT6831990.1 50S ribosomal protein L17 [bacterium]MBT6996790.1 50S ribosomal protein L17 [bacterium]MBT7772085.1 50S ribosomal protein L17 [bacterium]
MRHRSSKTILNRPADQRKALIRSQLTSLFLEGAICTTETKAKLLTSEAGKLISLVQRKLSKKEEFNAVRELKKVLFTEESQKRALDFIKKLKGTSGHTRATRVGLRSGDSAVKMQVELIADEK